MPAFGLNVYGTEGKPKLQINVSETIIYYSIIILYVTGFAKMCIVRTCTSI